MAEMQKLFSAAASLGDVVLLTAAVGSSVPADFGRRSHRFRRSLGA
jgi:hypothetical protein